MKVYFLETNSCNPELAGPFSSIREAEEYNKSVWDEADVELYEAIHMGTGSSPSKFKWDFEVGNHD